MLDHVRREHDRQDDALAKADVERENVLVHFGPTSVLWGSFFFPFFFFFCTLALFCKIIDLLKYKFLCYF